MTRRILCLSLAFATPLLLAGCPSDDGSGTGDGGTGDGDHLM